MVAVSAWRFEAHPEVWVLVATLVGLGAYVRRVIAPKVVAAGEPAVTRGQVRAFAAAVVVLWVAADWPMHDIGERYLYWVHMVQHTLLTMVLPPLLLLATPPWLAQLVLGSGRAGRVVGRLTRPVVAGLTFNLAVAFTHWSGLVNTTVRSGPLHYSVHLVLVVLALAAWTPVCGPLHERRLNPPLTAAYLFTLSIIPTLPAAWLTFAENPVYHVYDIPTRVFGLDVITDQQLAGFVMKIGTGAYLWTLMIVVFARWAVASQRADHEALAARADERALTYAEVERAFAVADPPVEATPAPPA